jgi:pimeloyl-ACP methyl ester carboxylesterase
MTTQTTFPSGDSYCAAWLTLPADSIKNGPHPVVILVHGGGATHDMCLPQYERAFSAAGLAVLAFDFRHLGASGGEPRQLMSIRRYLADIDSAIRFVRAHPELDETRAGLWGTSFGASHVLAAAARHPELAAAVIQCPVIRGRSPALASGLFNMLRLTGPILSDLLRAALRLPRRYVQIVGRPGEQAFVTVPGALEGWRSVMPADYIFDGRVTAGAALIIAAYDASRYARKVACPLLVCVSDRETLMDPALAVRAAAEAPHGRAIHYPADHFEVYHPPLFEDIVGDQIAFFQEHLSEAKGAGRASKRNAQRMSVAPAAGAKPEPRSGEP